MWTDILLPDYNIIKLVKPCLHILRASRVTDDETPKDHTLIRASADFQIGITAYAHCSTTGVERKCLTISNRPAAIFMSKLAQRNE